MNDSMIDIVKIDKSKRPRTTDGTIDWEGDVETPKMQQSSVAGIWEILTRFSENFEPALEEDKLLLMNMFSKISGGLRNQTATLHQIAQRSEQAGKAFDKYSPGKELQLPLLAVSQQQPDLFLGTDSFL